MQLGNNWKAVGKRLGDHIWERTGRCGGQAEHKLEDNGRHSGKHVWNKLGDTYHHLPPARQTRDKWMTSGTQRSETQVGNNWQVEGTWRRLDATPRLLEIEAIVSVGNHVFESNNQLCINPIVCLLEACLLSNRIGSNLVSLPSCISCTPAIHISNETGMAGSAHCVTGWKWETNSKNRLERE